MLQQTNSVNHMNDCATKHSRFNNTYIIADLHMSEQCSNSAILFKKFLNKIAQPGNSLYILGDFFNYWIGDDDENTLTITIKKALKNATSNQLMIFFMHGNRDFLIGERFAKETGVVLLSDIADLTLESKKIRLMHGDLLCTNDKSYLRFRNIVRSTIFQFIYLNLPLSLRKKAAEFARKKSKEKNTKQPNIDVTEKGVNAYTSNIDILIHGHTHKFAIHDTDKLKRYVLGDWGAQGSYIIFTGSNISMHKFSLESL